ncbi:MAG: hypothetical protein ACLGHN_09375 [Bacteriovoracia bacterium]
MEVPMDIRFRYVERRKKDLERCLLSLEKENFSELEKVGHQLKGNGVTFGHAELSAIGSHLEKAANLKDMSSLERALKEFSRWVNQQVN